MDESFTRAELLTTEALAGELVRRAKIEDVFLEKLGNALDNRVYDVFLFLWKYGPATWKELNGVFPKTTLSRALNSLEANEVIKLEQFKYFVQK